MPKTKEQFMASLLEGCPLPHGYRGIGLSAFAQLSADRILRIDLHCSGSTHFNALLLRVLTKSEGEIDRIVLKFDDYLEPQQVWHGETGRRCRVWGADGWDWYTMKDTTVGYPKTLAPLHEAIERYIQIWN